MFEQHSARHDLSQHDLLEHDLFEHDSFEQRAHRSRFYLDALVRRARVAVDHLELVGKAQETFGMANKKISAGIKAAVE
ncbi:MAG: hypothetical protein WCB53_03485, partial [Terriglobales bacterium]